MEKPTVAGYSSIFADIEMIVQRLASTATGKSMKYERIGPQEIVKYGYEELTLINIKDAYYKHFKDRLLDTNMDIVSQNGPSCSKLPHLKKFKLRQSLY